MNYCPSCGTKTAGMKFCSNCGTSPTITTQQTDKKWKKLILIGAGCVIGGILAIALIGPAGAILFVAAIPILIYASIGKWWHHA